MSILDPRSIADDYHYGSIDYEDLILKAPIPINDDGLTSHQFETMSQTIKHQLKRYRS